MIEPLDLGANYMVQADSGKIQVQKVDFLYFTRLVSITKVN